MRKRFEPQLEIGQLLIEDTPTPRGRGRDGIGSLIVALRELYKNDTYRNKIFDILEEKLINGRSQVLRLE